MPGQEAAAEKKPSTPKKFGKKADSVPVFLENPDGSFLEGVPPGYKEKTPPRSPRFAAGTWTEEDLVSAAMLDEFDFVFSRHQRLFAALVMMQLLLETAYNAVFVISANDAVNQVYDLYNHTVDRRTLEITFWTMFALNLTYGLVYYALAGMACYYNRARHYKTFASCCLVGIATQMLLAYINKFNLLVFFLRLVCYVYAKFLRNMAQTLSLLPPLAGRQREEGPVANSPQESPRGVQVYDEFGF